MSEDGTIRERLRAVEVELGYVKTGLSEMGEELKEYKEKMQGITDVISKKLRGSLSGGEKASIVVALIVSIASIVVSLVTAYG